MCFSRINHKFKASEPWFPRAVQPGDRAIQRRSPTPPLSQPLDHQIFGIRTDFQKRTHYSPHGRRKG